MGRITVKPPEKDSTIGRDVEYVDFTVLMILKQKPYLDWVIPIYGSKMQGISLESLNREPECYLLPYAEDVEHPQKWIKRNWEKLFMEELNAWTDAPLDWPQNRTFAMFEAWFQVKWSTAARKVGEDMELSFDMEG